MVTVSRAKVPGFTVDKYKAFKAKIVDHTPILDKKLTMTKLDDVENHIVTHTHIKMPWPLTNRSVFNLYHLYD